MKKVTKTIFIDMDGVLADFGAVIGEIRQKFGDQYADNPDEAPNAFKDIPLYPGALEAVHKLNESGRYNLYIATTATWKSDTALQDKKDWVEKHFGDLFYKRVLFTHHKNLLIGDYLIDDRLANGAVEFQGSLIHFGVDYKTNKPNPFPTWQHVLDELL